MLLFVYGTLRKQLQNAYLLEGATIVAEKARTNGVLYNTKYGYPALVEGDGTVYGELYEITNDMLPKLDELEDYVEGRQSNLYERKPRQVFIDETMVEAMVYIISEKKSSILTNVIANGDWKLYITEPQRH